MSALDNKIKDRDPDDPSFASPERPSAESKLPDDIRPAQRRMRQVVIAIGVLSVVFAVAVPGMQVAIVLLGGVLVGWGTFGLLVD